ncbi:heme biosynthesis HemY N-terminal domain-containing protein [Vandammella animalimorsus]|uniref:HemY N-terminal domain-containing protein n=1 Tax=Vandammella animalimorsus TaxID=2029117 RepID=A0A2A2AEF8_9BURK|nr:heme biosynthesis HemY N-terminal domain-containing protein [Vandammella animalimorsus]PAT36186.1 hypothetical protein CK620_02970 [Vandammella animalimorsus]
MRSALWVLMLFASAVAAALFLSNNGATVTLFWFPYRVDMSLNLLLLLLALVFMLGLLLLYALVSVWRMPAEARLWREYRHDAAAHHAFVRAAEHFAQARWQQAAEEAAAVPPLLAQWEAQHAQSKAASADVQAHARLLAVSQQLQQAAQQRLQGSASADSAPIAPATPTPALLQAPRAQRAAAPASPAAQGQGDWAVPPEQSE